MEGYDDNSILKGLDDDVDTGMPSEDEDEDPEMLAELESR